MQITHGCVRMYPDDIETLYDYVPEGTPVYIVKQPIKVGWLNNTLYIEAHPDLEGEEMGKDRRYAEALRLIQKATNEATTDFDQKALNQALADLDGEPVAIYERVSTDYSQNSAPAPAPAPAVPTTPIPAVTTEPAIPPPATPSSVEPLDTPDSIPDAEPETTEPVPSAPSGKGSPGGYYHGT